jgi:hypothetical protein
MAYTIHTTEMARVVMTVGPCTRRSRPMTSVTRRAMKDRIGIHRSPTALCWRRAPTPFNVVLNVIVLPANPRCNVSLESMFLG